MAGPAPQRFPLDRMDSTIYSLTVVAGGAILLGACGCGALGGAIAVSLVRVAVDPSYSVADAEGTPFDVVVTLLVCGFLVSIVASVWLLFRPLWFDLSPRGLHIRWPLRWKLIPLARIKGAEIASAAEMTSRYGSGVRVGAGGLWGGFGYRTSNQGLLHMYISRVDYVVLVHVRHDKPWILTPRDPERFVATLRELLGRSG